MFKGIDVATFQKKIDWGKVKGNVDFAIIRAGYGRDITQKDEYFERNYQECKDNSIPCGAYWYSYAENELDARLEAKTCIEVLKGKIFEYPIWFDIEEKTQFARGKEFISSIAKAFCDEMEAAGYFVGIYMSKSPMYEFLSEDIRKRYALWVAHYAAECGYKESHSMWQYSSSGSIEGVSGNVDMNKCCVDYPEIIKKAGLNGFKAPENVAPIPEKPVSEENIVYVVQSGDSLWDISRKYQTSVKAIMDLNPRIHNASLIYPGQEIKIK